MPTHFGWAFLFSIKSKYLYKKEISLVAKKTILKSTLNKADNYNLFGLVSSVNDYRLAWLINNKLNIELTKLDDLNISEDKIDESAIFSRYSFKIDSSSFELLSNKDLNSRKLFKQEFDYFFRYLGEDEDVKNKLNSIGEILIVNNLKENKKITDKVLQKLNSYFDCIV